MIASIIHTPFWYWLCEHGVELSTSIITLIAFLFTFKNIKRTDVRLEKEEKEKNKKTLVMIDLITQTERNNINTYAHILKSKQNIISDEKYEIGSPFYTSIKSYNKKASILYRRAIFCKDKKVSEELENYLKIFKETLNNNHVNLDLDSLKKINSTISKLNEAIQESKSFMTIENIYQVVLGDNKLLVNQQNNVEYAYRRCEKFIELLNEVSTDLSE